MKILVAFLPLALTMLAGEAAAFAQMSAPPMAFELPDLHSMSVENAAGVLHYCVRKQLVSTTVAEPVLERLHSRHHPERSPLYAEGESGHIVTAGRTFSIATARRHLRPQACDMVLRRAARFK